MREIQRRARISSQRQVPDSSPGALRSPGSLASALHIADASGKRVVTKLLLKGSNIEHVFK